MPKPGPNHPVNHPTPEGGGLPDGGPGEALRRVDDRLVLVAAVSVHLQHIEKLTGAIAPRNTRVNRVVFV